MPPEKWRRRNARSVSPSEHGRLAGIPSVIAKAETQIGLAHRIRARTVFRAPPVLPGNTTANEDTPALYTGGSSHSLDELARVY